MIASNILNEKFSFKSSRLSFRTAFDYHYTSYKLKRVDIDPYMGASMNIGNSPIKTNSESEFTPSVVNTPNDYQKISTNSNYLSFGGDIYLGTNFKFERFSIGLEVLWFGFDKQKGFGRTKVIYDQSIGGVVDSGEYYASSTWNNSLAFSELDLSTSRTSMYRGLRLNFSYYIK